MSVKICILTKNKFYLKYTLIFNFLSVVDIPEFYKIKINILNLFLCCNASLPIFSQLNWYALVHKICCARIKNRYLFLLLVNRLIFLKF